MKNTSQIKKKRSGLGICFFCCALGLISCEQEMDKYYQLPEWLKGNAQEVLKADGDYSIFLEAIERAGYAEMVGGKGIVTVIAPSDESFRKWLQDHRYASIKDVSVEE
jgi:hypothetical protein